MKKLIAVTAGLTLSLAMLFSGCDTAKNGRDGRDGKDGQDVTIEQIYDKYVQEYGEISYADFLKEYLNYTNDELDGVTGLQAVMNRSLMSGVSILTRFAYTEQHRNSLGFISKHTEYKVFNGSGVIIHLDKEAGDAYIVTNCHVVYDDTSDTVFSDDVRLYLYGQDESGVNFVVDSAYSITGDENYRMPATILGASVEYDIALLKVTNSDVLKRSSAVQAGFTADADVNVGESVFAVGNASGEGMSVSSGVISKDSEFIELTLSDKNNLLESDYNRYRVMRTTAPINHGNSGGALYNSKGEIMGIVNAKDDGEGVDNMGYVLPANNVKRIVGLLYNGYVNNGGEMVSSGGFKKALINIQTVVTDTYSEYDALTGRANIIETIRVDKILGAPSSGKLREGDYLKGIKIKNGDSVKDSIKVPRRYHISDIMLSAAEGDTVVFTVERGGEETEVSINIGKGNFVQVK